MTQTEEYYTPPSLREHQKEAEMREIQALAVLIRTNQVPSPRREELKKRPSQGASLQLLPLRPRPMPASTHAWHLAYQQSGNAMRQEGHSMPHTGAATQEQTQPPPTLFTSPPHTRGDIALLKNMQKRTKKERTGNGKHRGGMPPCNRQRDSPTQKKTSKTTTLKCTPQHNKKKSSSFCIKPPPLPSLGRVPTSNQRNAALILKGARNSCLGTNSIDRPATTAIECVPPSNP